MFRSKFHYLLYFIATFSNVAVNQNAPPLATSIGLTTSDTLDKFADQSQERANIFAKYRRRMQGEWGTELAKSAKSDKSAKSKCKVAAKKTKKVAKK